MPPLAPPKCNPEYGYCYCPCHFSIHVKLCVNVLCYRLLLIHVPLLVLCGQRVPKEKSSGKKESQERIRYVLFSYVHTHNIV